MKNLVVVLMGGLSNERKISFLTGKACSGALKKKGFKVINLDACGHFVSELKRLKPEIVLNALHGKYGEDGFVQSILESLKIKYTHSGVISSSLAMDKELSRILFKKKNLQVPKYIVLQKGINFNLNMNEWIAKDYKEYTSKANIFSCDLNHLSNIRKNLRQNAIKSPVFNDVDFANNFSDMLWKMWRKYTES